MAKLNQLGQDQYNGKKMRRWAHRQEQSNWANSNETSRTFRYRATLTNSFTPWRMAQRIRMDMAPQPSEFNTTKATKSQDSTSHQPSRTISPLIEVI
jgi:hypothetical protein